MQIHTIIVQHAQKGRLEQILDGKYNYDPFCIDPWRRLVIDRASNLGTIHRIAKVLWV